MTSLRRRVALWLLPPLFILMAVNATLAYRSALTAINQAYDRSLTAAIRAIAERTFAAQGQVRVDVPYFAFETFEDSAQERIFYAVFGPDGLLLTGYPDLVPGGLALQPGELRVIDAEYHGDPIRLGIMRKPLYDPALNGHEGIMIAFAETTESRTLLVRELFYDNLRRQGLLVGAGCLLLVLALTNAFRPLLELRDAMSRRPEDDLTPVPADNVASEVRPLIDAVNHHMTRLSNMLQARKRFLADAAHQIRTPLAVLGTQAEVGLRQNSVDEMRETFRSLQKSIGSTQRLANQMLALSRAEAANGLIQEQEAVDLSNLARDVATDLAPVAVKRRIELAFESTGPAPMTGHAAMLRELTANLVDNAIRYSPPGTQVLIATRGTSDAITLSVADQGPGIPPDERDKVFLRFYRILGQRDTHGSGLGLAIVREIAQAHGARVRLMDAPGNGLLVEVTFPRTA